VVELFLGCSSSSPRTAQSGGGGQATSGANSGGSVATGGARASGGTSGASKGGALGSGGSTQTSDAGITNCVEGTTCPLAGQQCTNAAGVVCLCGGPPGSAFLTCNVTSSSGGAGGTTNTGGNGGATATGGAKANGGATAAGGTPATGGTGGSSGTGGVIGQACTGAAPWGTGNGDYQIVVDAGKQGAAWSRYYEKGVACDHANTLLSTAYGRNSQAALKKGHDQAGFQYVRFHGVLDDDIGVYSESNGTAVYTWTRFDQVYDAIVAAGMRPIVEIDFTPAAMGGASTILTNLWYGGKSPNISTPKDWTKWQAFMAAIVQHLETRYGADEVRNNWFFEVWNEASWMYAGGEGGYPTLYNNTVKGLLAGDPLVKVGGPAASYASTLEQIPSLVSYAKNNSLKLDFLSWHRYSNDGAVADYADANGMLTAVDTINGIMASNGFKGLSINDEWGSSYDANVVRDSEVSASFIAKTVHLIGTDTKYPPPFMFAWWTISDLYEEFDTGTNTAFREGNFGLLLKGDAAIPTSFDVAKPAFNAFRLLHMMGDTTVSTTGGTTADGVNAVATVSSDGGAVQILVYNHVNGGTADSSSAKQVKLTVNNIPWTGNVNVRHYMLDRTHSNSYQSWVGMGKPSKPSQAQWTTLSSAAELCYFATTATETSWTVTYPQNIYGVSLITLTR